MIEKHLIEPTYAKDNGLWLLNIDKASMPGNFTVAERNVVYIPSRAYGGNHKHPRTEAFIGIGNDLDLIWQDEAGNRHVEGMSNEPGIHLFVIYALTPHVVINRGDRPALLIEFADGPQYDVETVNLLSV